MRKILFRGQCEATNEWVYGLPVTETTLSNSISHISQYYETERKFGRTNVKIKTESIGQFTGLLDKNGNKIFEGDIVRWDDNSNGEKWRVAVVEFNPDIQFRIIKIECDFIQSTKEGYVFRFGKFIYQDTQNHLEIIGNIHEEK